MEKKTIPKKTINDLPDEMLVEIFSYLCVEDLAINVRKVSKRWEEVAKENKLWRNLTYTPSNKISPDQMIEVLKGAPKLRKFVPQFEYIRGRLLEAVITYCKDIRSLRMKVNKADSSLIMSFVFECQNIEDLSIETDDFVSTKYLQMVSRCPKLKRLRLIGQTVDNSNNLFSDVVHGFPSLERLDISYMLHYRNKDLTGFLKQKKNKLRSLSVNCCLPGQKCLLPTLGKYCSALQFLHIFGHKGRSSVADFSNFKNMHHLRELAVTGTKCRNMDGVIDYFETGCVRNLEALDLSNFDIVDSRLTLAIFTKCLNLKELNLGNNDSLTDDCLEFIGNLICLEYLYLDGCNALTNKGVSFILKCTKLKCLNLNQCKNITSKSLVAICINLKLKILNMNACEVEPEVLMEICSTEHLKHFKSLCIRMGGKKIHLQPKNTPRH
ncbi:Uncharacterized protein GBIM_19047 [Gryllus bimaculatus]|nr:Uncharacterized protein GBIM_19047 [Gryllus bimaculatus]